ncbi:MAG: hypothetical protein GX595_07065 [Lentisphaerae bacterium]|nr:hypothetical protein [Lentisphaerota bacterium]
MSCRSCRRRFTLIELLAAMALMVIVALLSVRFFSNLQNVLQHSAGRTASHEDARLALGLLARDLQTVVARANDVPGSDIRIHQPNSTSLWFVTDSSADSTGACSFVEVGYRLRGQTLERASVDQSSAAWNLYGDRDDASDQDGYQTVIDGVTGFQIVCYDGQYVPTTPDQTTQLPSLFSIRISVLDPADAARWQSLPEADRPAFEMRAARTFWKTIRPR